MDVVYLAFSTNTSQNITFEIFEPPDLNNADVLETVSAWPKLIALRILPSG